MQLFSGKLMAMTFNGGQHSTNQNKFVEVVTNGDGPHHGIVFLELGRTFVLIISFEPMQKLTGFTMNVSERPKKV